MLQRKMKLCLTDIKEISFKDKETGEQVKKYRYTFFTPENAVETYYSDKKMFADRVIDASGFVAEKANEYTFEGSVWNNVLTWRLAV